MALDIGFGDPDIKGSQASGDRGLCAECAQYPKCLFHMRKLGGFKGQGIRYIGYRLVTDASERSNAKEDFCTCVAFVEVLQDRMLTAQQLMSEGKLGEMVSVVAQQGETITQGFQVGFNARNEIIKTIPNLVDPLRAAGYKVNVDDGSPAVEFRDVEFERTIPIYGAVAAGTAGYSSEIAKREFQRLRDEEEADTEAWQVARQRKVRMPVAKAIAEAK